MFGECFLFFFTFILILFLLSVSFLKKTNKQTNITTWILYGLRVGGTRIYLVFFSPQKHWSDLRGGGWGGKQLQSMDCMNVHLWGKCRENGRVFPKTV